MDDLAALCGEVSSSPAVGWCSPVRSRAGRRAGESITGCERPIPPRRDGRGRDAGLRVLPRDACTSAGCRALLVVGRCRPSTNWSCGWPAPASACGNCRRSCRHLEAAFLGQTTAAADARQRGGRERHGHHAADPAHVRRPSARLSGSNCSSCWPGGGSAWCVLGLLARPRVARGAVIGSADHAVDTVFGRWMGQTGWAGSLVVLTFSCSWVLPLLTSLVAGDIFARRTGGNLAILAGRRAVAAANLRREGAGEPYGHRGARRSGWRVGDPRWAGRGREPVAGRPRRAQQGTNS